jgi:Domain of unknown function (DUF4351)
VLRVLNRRVGSLEPDVDERLQALSVPQMKDLLDAALDFQGMDELIGWMSIATEPLFYKDFRLLEIAHLNSLT